ncbi:Asp/Glu racemase [Rhodobacteraceae bacterium LMO-12]|nr:Asp/Glu racemase [Rhodobacteraceae bacterium LMO-JJ12]
MGLSFQLDEGSGVLGRLGLIVLSTDETLEDEARKILARRPVSLLHARIPAEADVTPEALRTMEAHMSATAALLPKGLDAVGYGCTSGATVIGPERVAALIAQTQDTAAVSDPLSAVLAALAALEVRRIALLTPYVESVNAPLINALAQGGIDVLAQASFQQSDDWTVARICEADTLNAIKTLGRTEGCEAVFVSCTNLRTLGILQTAEADLGIPVVSSNLALVWHLLRLVEVDAQGWTRTRLFERF